MRTKDTILLEQAYEAVHKQKTLNESIISQDEANNLLQGFNMLPGDRKQQAFERLKDLVGIKVSLSRAVRLKQSSGYGRDDGSATVPGSGGSVAHTETESEDGVFAQGIIQDVKVSEGEEDYTKNGNLILSIDDQDYNVNQGTTVKVKFLEDSAGGRSFRSGDATWAGHGRFSGMKR
jgi:hypothetical protein